MHSKLMLYLSSRTTAR